MTIFIEILTTNKSHIEKYQYFSLCYVDSTYLNMVAHMPFLTVELV